MTVFSVPQHEGHSWHDWTCAFINNNATAINVPYPFEEERWQDWAQELCLVAELIGYQMPWPQGYRTWREWVDELAQALVASA